MSIWVWLIPLAMLGISATVAGTLVLVWLALIVFTAIRDEVRVIREDGRRERGR